MGGIFCEDAEIIIRRSTIVGNHYPVELYGFGQLARLELENTILAFNHTSPVVVGYEACEAELRCCDVYGNEGGDWIGMIGDQFGLEGNICEDPLFCSAAGEIFSLHSDSPCAEENNLECGQIGAFGIGCGVSTSVPEVAAKPSMSRIFPNPTAGPVTIDFTLPGSDLISVKILDVSGRVVRDLFNGRYPYVDPGEFSLTWDGRDDAGTRVAAGVYLARVEGQGGRRTTRVVVTR
jgi:hypothetical protein